MLLISILYVVFVLRGMTSYPRWMAALNPILLVIAAFVLYVAIPPLGGIFMPVAMNFAHIIFFTASTLLTLREAPAGR